jgi:hypothetical protein
MIESTSAGRRRFALLALLLALPLASGGCDRLRFQQPDLRLPDQAEAAGFYHNFEGVSTVELSGNVVVLHVHQPIDQLRRGGSLWARVGPYIYLLSPGTRDLLTSYPGVAAVRVITYTEREKEVARAMLTRDGMSDYQWQRSLYLLGLALKGGTDDPSRLTDLVRWGEQYTEFNYSPAYVSR